MVAVASLSLSLSSPNSLLGLRNPPIPRRLRLRASSSAAAAAAAAAAPSAAAAAAAGGTLYDVLGIGAAATGREIKAAYRRLARERHPDVVRGAAASADEFIRIHAAYATLSDPDQRARYDRSMPLSSAAAAAAAAAAPPRGDRRPFSSCAAPSFARSGRRTWETDQCW